MNVIRSAWSGWGDDGFSSERPGARSRERLRGAPRHLAASSTAAEAARARAVGVEVLH